MQGMGHLDIHSAAVSLHKLDDLQFEHTQWECNNLHPLHLHQLQPTVNKQGTKQQ